MRYTVKHAYRARRDGRDFGPWTEGETVELEELDADWVNRDSPGTLAGEDQADELVDEPDTQDQADEAADEDDDAGKRQQPPPRNRQRKSGPNRKS